MITVKYSESLGQSGEEWRHLIMWMGSSLLHEACVCVGGGVGGCGSVVMCIVAIKLLKLTTIKTEVQG